MPSKRKAISKSLRFEVFKRDSFKCQYCGRSAPEIVLHCDHIHPVADGGDTDITNLITSCVDCNLGKGARKLSDQSALKKQKAQLDELQERREQLAMLMQWKQGLRSIEQETIDRLADYWGSCFVGMHLNDRGLASLKKTVDKFGVEEVLSAIDIAHKQYCVIKDGKATSDSTELAFSKISGICRIRQSTKENPELRDLYYAKGILKNRCPYYFNEWKAMEWMKAAISWGVTGYQLKEIALASKNWSHFDRLITDAIDSASGGRSRSSRAQ